MSARVPSGAIALSSGILFGFGLVVSGMTRPQKVIGFLDLFGAWDPSLAFVMMGAIGVHLVAHRLIRRRATPLFARAFSIPTRGDVDLRLIAGAAVFGVGWGLGGYCPGPAVTSLASGAIGVAVFVLAMLVATFATARIEAAFARSRAEREPAASAPERSAPIVDS